MTKKKESSGKHRIYTPEFKLKAVQRMESGESVAVLSRELGVRRKVLYDWRTRHRERGMAGLKRGPGRPRQTAQQRQQRSSSNTARHIAELERKVGRQALLIDFLQRAFKRVEELRHHNSEPGATASTGRSGA